MVCLDEPQEDEDEGEYRPSLAGERQDPAQPGAQGHTVLSLADVYALEPRDVIKLD